MTDQVQKFYENYPYPPPIDNLESYRKKWSDQNRLQADFHLVWPWKSFQENFSILVAGCGTSQAAKHAIRWPKAEVIGIDFSETSVRHTENLKKKYHLKNLQVHQLPIERIGELDKKFDQIVCTGVLHHLAEPSLGLKALREALKPDGAIHLMVYAKYGRLGIYMMQEFCKRVGISATDDGIRDLIATLQILPNEHPLKSLLNEAPDFQQEAALADALLHPQDRAYSVPELFDLTRQADLTFGRWIRQAPYSSHCGTLDHIPQASEILRLPLEEQYAAIELFRGTMVRHSMIAYRTDPSTSHSIHFTDDRCLDYIPIRIPGTICVEEKLPLGIAAVLINPEHTYRDLYLPIDSDQKHWFDAIDGKRSIRELLKEINKNMANHHTYAFFEKLWWYDQIVLAI